MAPHQDTQTRSRLSIGEDGPSDSALAAARDGRLRRPAAERHAARCASRVLCSGGAPWRYSPLLVGGSAYLCGADAGTDAQGSRSNDRGLV